MNLDNWIKRLGNEDEGVRVAAGEALTKIKAS